MRKKHSTANILLVELVLVILFFMLCVATIVEMFGLARTKSAFAKAASQAMMVVENLEERLAGTADASLEMEREGFVPTDGGWEKTDGLYTIRAVETREETEGGTLRTVTFTAQQNTGKALFELPVVNYLPGEVSP